MTGRAPGPGRRAGPPGRSRRPGRISPGRSSRRGPVRTRRPASAARRSSRGQIGANRAVLAVLVLVALAAIYGAAGLRRPALPASAAVRSPGQLAVTSALLGCTAPGSGGSIGGGVAAASTPAGNRAANGGIAPGQVILTPAVPRAGRAGRAVPASLQPGQLAIAGVTPAPALSRRQQAKLAMPPMAGGLVPTAAASGGLTVTASGQAAQGLDVEQLGPDGRPSSRCGPPGSDFWFVGPGAKKLHIQVYLLNVDNGQADAAVAAQTDSGPLLSAPDTGIVIPPHAMVVQNLDKLMNNARAIALHVTTSTGRVVAAVRETTNLAQPGIWLPVAQEPATTQVLPGMSAQPGNRELYITVPGGSAAQVKVTAVTPRGSYQPTGASGISVLQHQTTGIAIPSLDGLPGALEINSNVPVTAELGMSGGPAGAPGAFATGSDPIGEQGVVAASPVGRAGESDVVLAAPRQAVSVRITVALPGVPLATALAGGTAPAGAAALAGVTSVVVHIGAKSATQVRIGRPKGAGSARVSLVAIVVTPLAGSGPVYAAQLSLGGGALLTVLPVQPSPTVIRLPAVQESLRAVLGSQ